MQKPQRKPVSSVISDSIEDIYRLIVRRDAELEARQYDTTYVDRCIIQIVRKLAAKDNILLSHIRAGNGDELKGLFDRLASLKIIDVRQKFNAAATVIECEEKLTAAIKELGGASLDLVKKF